MLVIVLAVTLVLTLLRLLSSMKPCLWGSDKGKAIPDEIYFEKKLPRIFPREFPRI